MPPNVTTSRKHRQKFPLVPVILAVAAGAVVFLVTRKKANHTTRDEATAGFETVANAVANAQDSTVEDGVAEASSSQNEQASAAPKISLPDVKGEPTAFALAKTGTVIRAISSGSGVSSTNVVSRGEPVFVNEVENFIYRFADSAGHPSMIMTRFGGNAEEEVRKILEADIIIYEDDDGETVRLKEHVAGLKQDILKAIEEGYDATDVLNEMREDNNGRVRNRTRMQRELNSLLKSNLVDQAVQFLNDANERLSNDFLPPLSFPEDILPGPAAEANQAERTLK